MLPGIENHDWVMVSKASYFSSDPAHGDVIVFNPPFQSEFPFIKRIIAVPGDTVEIKDGKVYLNNTALDEPYILQPPSYTMPAREIPEGEYFVLGDNRNNADDSHIWGKFLERTLLARFGLSIGHYSIGDGWEVTIILS